MCQQRWLQIHKRKFQFARTLAENSNPKVAMVLVCHEKYSKRSNEIETQEEQFTYTLFGTMSLLQYLCVTFEFKKTSNPQSECVYESS
jgi:hypothetical protein